MTTVELFHGLLAVILYALSAVYFAGVMVRLMLTLTPVVCILAAIAFSKVFSIYLRDDTQRTEVVDDADDDKEKNDKYYDKVCSFYLHTQRALSGVYIPRPMMWQSHTFINTFSRILPNSFGSYSTISDRKWIYSTFVWLVLLLVFTPLCFPMHKSWSFVARIHHHQHHHHHHHHTGKD